MSEASQQKPDQPAVHDDHALYQQALLAHHKSPVGYNLAIVATHSAQGVNATCGDDIKIAVEIEQNYLQALAFYGDSCAICRASASMLCQHLKGLSVAEVLALSQKVKASLSENVSLIGVAAEQFEPLRSVEKFPVRKQCALLPWTTLEQALNATS
ncbi:Fe-S cluster assembly sulfur transfer protein SufU [Thalassotalea sp. G2M2-11]|uniref:Fe-S cluster assembly sulfur transfer protein SufU n=1 Tax=Thalassotalea sp. G2M2-11 TaxID=2787627 RepID=UPI0019CF90A8|nr:SUF system NifU family Fe-S cluster assembly protein [Thalassotalea sp. G2M2-11]